MKIESIRIAFLAMVLGGALVFGLASKVPNVQADKEFSTKSIEGTWGFLSDGYMKEYGYTVSTGLAMFDEKGICSIDILMNTEDNKQIKARSERCEYSVRPDGTGTLISEFKEFGITTSDLVIVAKENKILFIKMDKGSIVKGVFDRQ